MFFFRSSSPSSSLTKVSPKQWIKVMFALSFHRKTQKMHLRYLSLCPFERHYYVNDNSFYTLSQPGRVRRSGLNLKRGKGVNDVTPIESMCVCVCVCGN